MNHVLVDTSVWVHHFRQSQDALVRLLALDLVLSHPWVLGEIACGTPPARPQTLASLSRLRYSPLASPREVLALIERERLYGLGCGLVDITLLTSALLKPGVKLWTLDQRLDRLAERFGIQHRPLRP